MSIPRLALPLYILSSMPVIVVRSDATRLADVRLGRSAGESPYQRNTREAAERRVKVQGPKRGRW